MTGKELKKLLLINGWEIARIKGSHHIFEKDGKTITVPIHNNKDLKKGLELAILKQAGLR